MTQTLDRVLRWSSGLAASTALFAIMWLTLVDVIGRKFFNHSIPGGLEITEMLMVVVIFGALPLVSWRDEHVVFDSLDHFIPARLRILQQKFVHLICACAFGLLSWLLVLRARRFLEYGDTTAYLLWPIAPVAYVMSACLVITALVHLALILIPGPGRAPLEKEAT